MGAGAVALALGSAAGAAITNGTAARATALAAAAAQPIPVGPTQTYTQPPSGTPTCTNYTYTVPADVTSVLADVVGQAGQSGGSTTHHSGGSGGKGEEVQAEFPVVPGENLVVNVAWTGLEGTSSDGGGSAGDLSDISAQAVPPGFCATSWLVIAGGGGGGGDAGTAGNGGNGGGAGFTNGAGGGNGGPTGLNKGGSGGTQTAGGTGGSGCLGTQGFDGGIFHGGSAPVGGGGGGSGYYGGGGGGAHCDTSPLDGGAGGGGGGSSLVAPGGHAIAHGPASGAPLVSITPVLGLPLAPTSVTAVASGPNRATVTFTPPAADGGEPILYYRVFATAGDPGFNQTGNSSGSPLVLNGLTPGQTYTIQVAAVTADGVGPKSTPSNAIVAFRVPGAPVITSATPGNGSATVAFTPSAADTRLGNPVTSYTVTARLGVNVKAGPGVTATGTGSPITVTGLTNGQNYTVTVTAANAAGSGPQSAPGVVFPSTVPGAPADVTAVNATPVGASTGTVNLTFSAPADTGGRPVQSYTAVSSPGGITVTSGAVVGSSTGSIQVTGLTIGTSYTFTVFATNGTGNGPASDPSNAVTPAGVGTPSPPLVPGASTLDSASYVSCLPPTDDGGSAITSYTVTSSPGGITATGLSCPILVTGLTDGTTYTFTVTATNADGGTSQPSQPTGPITPHAPSGTPPANDNFANAQVITGASGSVTGSNIGATKEPGETNIQDTNGGASVWYQWTVPADGSYQIDTCSANPDFPSNIGLFLGNSASAPEFGAGPSQDICPADEAGALIDTGPISGGITLDIKVDGLNNPDVAGFPAYEGVFTLEWAQVS